MKAVVLGSCTEALTAGGWEAGQVGSSLLSFWAPSPTSPDRALQRPELKVPANKPKVSQAAGPVTSLSPSGALPPNTQVSAVLQPPRQPGGPAFPKDPQGVSSAPVASYVDNTVTLPCEHSNYPLFTEES